MSAPPNRRSVAGKLRRRLAGQVLADTKAIVKFSRDFSIYQVPPLLVALPADAEDLGRIIHFAAEEGLAITPRGGGSGTAGSALGNGIVVALPRGGAWEEITGFAVTDGVPSVEAGAGVFHNDLQKYLRARGYFLPADVSSAKISRIGGNIATKASGPHALQYGSIDRFVNHLEFLTAQGELIDTSDDRLRADEQATKLLAARANLKTASGYNMFCFLPQYPTGTLLARLLAGSVGTLGFITRATLRGEIYQSQRATMLLFFADLVEAGRAVCAIREAGVAAIEIINRETIRIVRQKSGLGKRFAPDADALFVEFEGPDLFDRIDRVKKMLKAKEFRTSREPAIATTNEEMEELWDLRKMLLPLVSNPAPGIKALSVVNDVGVDPSRLADCIAELQRLFQKEGLEGAIYGHAGSGNLHLRPFFDLHRPGLRDRIQRVADGVYAVILRSGGTITAEHGMGRLRAPYLEPEWGERIYGYMKDLKTIFDPQGIFNPGAMFSNSPITENLRPELLRYL
ncbi:MAG: FAD-binding oxidoreductase [Deltaproteobacteria bacterium]